MGSGLQENKVKNCRVYSMCDTWVAVHINIWFSLTCKMGLILCLAFLGNALEFLKNT
jgi:hypothetical protein